MCIEKANNYLSLCPGFDWDRANFLHSDCLLLCVGFRRKIVFITHPCFSSFWTMLTLSHWNLNLWYCSALACHTALLARRLAVHKLRVKRTRTAVPNWLKGYSLPYGIRLHNKTGGIGQDWWPLHEDWLNISLWVVKIAMCILVLYV